MPGYVPVIISACLCGSACRYDGGSAPVARLVELARKGLALPVCPEVLGGLPVPREPCELANGRALTRTGDDYTEAFLRGAKSVLALAVRHGARLAVLKDKSPSCGSARIHDGSFSKTLVSGEGLTAALLRRHGLTVLHEGEELPENMLRTLCTTPKNSMSD